MPDGRPRHPRARAPARAGAPQPRRRRRSSSTGRRVIVAIPWILLFLLVNWGFDGELFMPLALVLALLAVSELYKMLDETAMASGRRPRLLKILKNFCSVHRGDPARILEKLPDSIRIPLRAEATGRVRWAVRLPEGFSLRASAALLVLGD